MWILRVNQQARNVYTCIVYKDIQFTEFFLGLFDKTENKLIGNARKAGYESVPATGIEEFNFVGLLSSGSASYNLTNVKLIVEYGTDEDAIGEIEASNANARDAIYNLSGQRVSTPGRGLYIINGKKILFK